MILTENIVYCCMNLNLNKNCYYYTKAYDVDHSMTKTVRRAFMNSCMILSVKEPDDCYEIIKKVSQIIFNKKGW